MSQAHVGFFKLFANSKSSCRMLSVQVLQMAAFTHTTKEACAELRISDSTLRRFRAEGIFKPGMHFRSRGDGAIKPALLWDVAAVNQALSQRSRRVLAA